MSAPTDTELRAAYLDWFDFRGIPSIALTLTFKPKLGRKELDTEVAEEALRHFLRRLNRMRGNSRKRSKKTPLQTMAIREGYFGGGYPQFHYHLQIEVPGDSDPQEFADRCLGCDPKRPLPSTLPILGIGDLHKPAAAYPTADSSLHAL
jgi:hypothetical protein